MLLGAGGALLRGLARTLRCFSGALYLGLGFFREGWRIRTGQVRERLHPLRLALLPVPGIALTWYGRDVESGMLWAAQGGGSRGGTSLSIHTIS